MSSNENSRAKINLGTVSNFACEIFDPPLDAQEKEQISIIDYVIPIGTEILKFNGVPCEVKVYKDDYFGWNNTNRLTAFQKHVEEKVAPLLKNRKLDKVPLKLGSKSLDLFQQMEEKLLKNA